MTAGTTTVAATNASELESGKGDHKGPCQQQRLGLVDSSRLDCSQRRARNDYGFPFPKLILPRAHGDLRNGERNARLGGGDQLSIDRFDPRAQITRETVGAQVRERHTKLGARLDSPKLRRNGLVAGAQNAQDRSEIFSAHDILN